MGTEIVVWRKISNGTATRITQPWTIARDIPESVEGIISHVEKR